MGKYKEISYEKEVIENDKEVLKCIYVLMLLLIITIFSSIVTCEKYKKELDIAVELRQKDLEVSKTYIRENNELKRQYEEIEIKYEELVDYIRTSDKYQLPEEKEE